MSRSVFWFSGAGLGISIGGVQLRLTDIELIFGVLYLSTASDSADAMRWSS